MWHDEHRTTTEPASRVLSDSPQGPLPHRRGLLRRIVGGSNKKQKYTEEMADLKRREREEQQRIRKERATEKIERAKQKVNTGLGMACLPPLFEQSGRSAASVKAPLTGPIIHFEEGITVTGWQEIFEAAYPKDKSTKTVSLGNHAAAIRKLYQTYTYSSGHVCLRCQGNDLPATAQQAATAVQNHVCPTRSRSSTTDHARHFDLGTNPSAASSRSHLAARTSAAPHPYTYSAGKQLPTAKSRY